MADVRKRSTARRLPADPALAWRTVAKREAVWRGSTGVGRRNLLDFHGGRLRAQAGALSTGRRTGIYHCGTIWPAYDLAGAGKWRLYRTNAAGRRYCAIPDLSRVVARCGGVLGRRWRENAGGTECGPGFGGAPRVCRASRSGAEDRLGPRYSRPQADDTKRSSAPRKTAYFFFPCAATASMAAFTFSGSPR